MLARRWQDCKRLLGYRWVNSANKRGKTGLFRLDIHLVEAAKLKTLSHLDTITVAGMFAKALWKRCFRDWIFVIRQLALTISMRCFFVDAEAVLDRGGIGHPVIQLYLSYVKVAGQIRVNCRRQPETPDTVELVRFLMFFRWQNRTVPNFRLHLT